MIIGDEIVKKNKYEIDMCNGSIMDKLISFSLPLMLSGILQLMFNAVDIAGEAFSGSEALAAVGSTTALINVFTNFFIGNFSGANVLAARFLHPVKRKKCPKPYIHRSYWLWSAGSSWHFWECSLPGSACNFSFNRELESINSFRLFIGDCLGLKCIEQTSLTDFSFLIIGEINLLHNSKFLSS